MSANEEQGRGARYGTMLRPQEAERRLREQGARMTAQRRAVLELLAGNRTHPTADELMALVRARLGCVSPATIYNTLDTLEKLGFVRRLEGLEQRARFDPDTSDHQHAICLRCHKVWDLGPGQTPAGLPDGFILYNTLVQGICGPCAHAAD